MEILGAAGIVMMAAAMLLPRSLVQSLLLVLAALCGSLVSAFLFDRMLLALLFLMTMLAAIIREMCTVLDRARVRLTDEEQVLRDLHFPAMPVPMARAFLDQGLWLNARRGDILVHARDAEPGLFYMVIGSAVIDSSNGQVGQYVGGEMISAATLSDAQHGADAVRLLTSARLWFVPAQALWAYLAANPALSAMLGDSVVQALRDRDAAGGASSADGGADAGDRADR